MNDDYTVVQYIILMDRLLAKFFGQRSIVTIPNEYRDIFERSNPDLERQRRAFMTRMMILSLLKDYGKKRKIQIARILNIAPTTVQDNLEWLERKSVIEKIISRGKIGKPRTYWKFNT